MRAKLLIRADATIAMGTGHVMRCLALAQAWQDGGGEAAFAVAEVTPAVRARLLSESCEIVSVAGAPGGGDDSARTIAIAREQDASWLVLDGYQFEADYLTQLKGAGVQVLFIDDYGHAGRYSSDFVLNQNVNAKAELYADRAPHTRLLLGPRYALLRREFGVWRDWKRAVSPVCRRVLVMLGGSDPENLTARVIDAIQLAQIDGLEAAIVVGGSNPHIAQLQKAADQCGLKIALHKDVTRPADLMAAADVAVSAAGSTCWELCLLGLPSLVIDVADNQTTVAQELHRRGCAIHVGNRTASASRIAEGLRSLVEASELRESLALRSRELVDGRGAMRVVAEMSGRHELWLRPVQAGDRKRLWEWVNDPEVRAASFSPEPISWESHVAWFAKRLDCSPGNLPPSFIFVAEDDAGSAVGQVRFDAGPEGRWHIDVSVDQAMRGRGFAAKIMASGIRELKKRLPNAQVHAYVKPANVASIKAVEACGFRRVGTQEIRGHEAIHFIYREN